MALAELAYRRAVIIHADELEPALTRRCECAAARRGAARIKRNHCTAACGQCGRRNEQTRPGDRSEERRVGQECVVRVDLGGRRILTQKNHIYTNINSNLTLNKYLND